MKRMIRCLLFAWSISTVSILIGSDVPNVRFGIEVSDQDGGVRIEEIKPSRPIATKLAARDVLISYVVVDEPERTIPIRTADDIDLLKAAIANGRQVSLTFLRPQDSRIPPSRYLQQTVLIDALDLLPVSEVETANVPESATVSVPYTTRAPTANDENEMVSVNVFYATDRKLDAGQYSGARDMGSNPIKYGVCEVTIPPDHRTGQLEGPKWWRLEFSADPRKHVYLKDVNQAGKTIVFEAISKSFESVEAGTRRRALLFVHGYNVSFQDAARRSAQMHYDLNFPGISAFYSWPSNANLQSYVSDSGDIEWSTPHIKEFLTDFDTFNAIDEIYVIAHSMGNRGVIKALVEMRLTGAGRKIKEIILAAADVDAAIFERDLAPQIANYYPRTTVYASANDKALWGSEALSEAYRVGEIRNREPTIRTLPTFDVIDASNVATDLLGHSYYGDGTSVISDIFQLIVTNQNPPRFNLSEQNGSRGKYWRFR